MFQSLSAELRRPRIALAIAGVSAGMAFATGASAAECVNGYRTLGNDVTLACEGAAPSPALASFPSEDRSVVAPAAAALGSGGARPLIADSWGNCQPGQYRIIKWEEHDMLLAC